MDLPKNLGHIFIESLKYFVLIFVFASICIFSVNVAQILFEEISNTEGPTVLTINDVDYRIEMSNDENPIGYVLCNGEVSSS